MAENMTINMTKSNPYLLLTPGPLSTTDSVKQTMMRDWCTWDDDYKARVQAIRQQLLALACADSETYTTILMQGSGTFGVEATIGTAIDRQGKLLVVSNGAYGERMVQIARTLDISCVTLHTEADQLPDCSALAQLLEQDTAITHVACVHCETTSGILNPLADLLAVIKRYDKIAIVDAMSSFGGIPIDVPRLGIDYLISSANKCIQGVPGFSFIIARRARLTAAAGNARSLSLDLYDQWRVMEEEQGKWRFTSPTHTVRAFEQALLELEQEGGISARHARYCRNQQLLSVHMQEAGFQPLLAARIQSPFITTFYYPDHPRFSFSSLYHFLKERGFVIYPGKLTAAEVFRIGSIGDVHPADIDRLGAAVRAYRDQALADPGDAPAIAIPNNLTQGGETG